MGVWAHPRCGASLRTRQHRIVGLWLRAVRLLRARREGSLWPMGDCDRHQADEIFIAFLSLDRWAGEGEMRLGGSVIGVGWSREQASV